MTDSDETLENLNGIPEKNKKFMLWAFLFIIVYAITSFMAMNDLWKFDVDQRYGSFFGNPMRHYDSGMQYYYISLAALIGACIFFFLQIRKAQTNRLVLYAILTGVFIIIGFSFKFTGNHWEPTFMEYISAHFYPFWAFTLAGLFAVCGVAAFLNKKEIG